MRCRQSGVRALALLAEAGRRDRSGLQFCNCRDRFAEAAVGACIEAAQKHARICTKALERAVLSGLKLGIVVSYGSHASGLRIRFSTLGLLLAYARP